MKTELPKVYANAIDKEIKNNERVSYSKSEERDVKEDVKLSKSDILKNELKGNINQKINNIFNAQNYI